MATEVLPTAVGPAIMITVLEEASKNCAIFNTYLSRVYHVTKH
jgi:hypothetical protein